MSDSASSLYILEPDPGSTVDYQDHVRVVVPTGATSVRLYILSEDGKWHPQRWPEPTKKPNIWDCLCTFGLPDSKGHEFFVIAIQTDANTGPVDESELPQGNKSQKVRVIRQSSSADSDREVLLQKSKKSTHFVGSVVVPIICVFLGAGLEYGRSVIASRTRSLLYYSPAGASILDRPELSGNDVKILIGGKAVENISTVSLAMFNTTDQDYDDVQLNVAFNAVDGKTPRLIQANVKTPKAFYDASPTTETVDAIQCSYSLKAVNRTRTPVFYVVYLFEGNKPPEMSVDVVKAGLQAVRVDLPKSNDVSERWEIATVGLLALIFSPVLVGLIFGYRISIMDRRDRRALGEACAEHGIPVGWSERVFGGIYVPPKDKLLEGGGSSSDKKTA